MAYVENVDLVPEASRNAAGSQQSPANFGGSTQALLHVRVSQLSGALTVTLEDSLDGVNWFRIASTTINQIGNHSLRVAQPFSDNLRVSWLLGGSAPSATFAASLAAL